jgi:hypothetical protein
LFFALFLAASLLAMKVVTYWRRPSRETAIKLICSPFPALRTWESAQPASLMRIQQVLLSVVGHGALLLTVYWAWWQLLMPISPPMIVIQYLAIFPELILTFLVTHSFRLMGLSRGVVFAPSHPQIFQSQSLGEFWGRRWNLWISDWFREALQHFSKQSAGRSLRLMLAGIFVFSGLFHEFILQFAYFVATGKSLFGYMLIYFLIQYLGVIAEHYWIKAPAARRANAYLFTILPIPLFNNEATLHVLYLI